VVGRFAGSWRETGRLFAADLQVYEYDVVQEVKNE
jgi:hypothetical protein